MMKEALKDSREREALNIQLLEKNKEKDDKIREMKEKERRLLE